MTPKEKAIELHTKMFYVKDELHKYPMCFDSAKKCAIIAVDEIDLVIQKLTPENDEYCYLQQLEYWQEVKQEIEKL